MTKRKPTRAPPASRKRAPESSKAAATNVGSPVNPYYPQPYVLGSRTIQVQGNEPLALDWLQNIRKIHPDKILHHSEGKITPIRFLIKRTEYEYTPDIQAGRRVVEIMNLWTLALDWNNARHRALGTKQQGIDHKMLVPDGEGSICCLPNEWTKRSFGWVENWFRSKQRLSSVRILSLDPGSSNFAWSVIDAHRDGHREVKATGMIQMPLKTLMGDISDGINRFVHEIDQIIFWWNPDSLAAERFMTRGNKGATIELINIMLGTLITKFSYDRNKRTKLLPASQWKNEFNRYDNLDKWYASAPPNMVIHQMDAVGIGLYCADYWFHVKAFSTKGTVAKVLRQLKGLK